MKKQNNIQYLLLLTIELPLFHIYCQNSFLVAIICIHAYLPPHDDKINNCENRNGLYVLGYL